MDESIDGLQLAASGSAVERHHDTGDGTRSEADANEMTGQKVEAVGNEVTEGARWSAHAREDGDLRRPSRHKS